MKRYSVPGLTTLVIFAAFWAYIIADSLIRGFFARITFIDLGVLLVLGLIAGLALGLAISRGRREESLHFDPGRYPSRHRELQGDTAPAPEMNRA
jgi:hypothetical protein